MVYWLSAAITYLVLTFLGSALMVRYAPDLTAARLLRHRLALFPFVPAMLAGLASLGVLRLVARVPCLIGRLFEALSGRRQYRRVRYGIYYGKRPGVARADPGLDWLSCDSPGQRPDHGAGGLPSTAVPLIVPTSSAPSTANSNNA
jgi:hypothetical protein